MLNLRENELKVVLLFCLKNLSNFDALHNPVDWECIQSLKPLLQNINRSRTSFFENRTNLNVFIYWWSNSKTLFLAPNKQTSNIEPIQTCSSIGDRTRTPYFWLWTNRHRTLNLIGLSLDLLNYSSKWLEHYFFKRWMNSNVFISW